MSYGFSDIDPESDAEGALSILLFQLVPLRRKGKILNSSFTTLSGVNGVGVSVSGKLLESPILRPLASKAFPSTLNTPSTLSTPLNTPLNTPSALSTPEELISINRKKRPPLKKALSCLTTPRKPDEFDNLNSRRSSLVSLGTEKIPHTDRRRRSVENLPRVKNKENENVMLAGDRRYKRELTREFSFIKEEEHNVIDDIVSSTARIVRLTKIKEKKEKEKEMEMEKEEREEREREKEKKEKKEKNEKEKDAALERGNSESKLLKGISNTKLEKSNSGTKFDIPSNTSRSITPITIVTPITPMTSSLISKSEKSEKREFKDTVKSNDRDSQKEKEKEKDRIIRDGSKEKEKEREKEKENVKYKYRDGRRVSLL